MNCKYLILLVLTALILPLCLCCCTGSNVQTDTDGQKENTDSGKKDEGDKAVTYECISQEEAKRIMDSGEDIIILDVRTKEEFDEGHIQGAILISDYEITNKAETLLPDKNALILVYCRTGRRSKNASLELCKLGYTNVKEFGGITTWQYGTVTE